MRKWNGSASNGSKPPTASFIVQFLWKPRVGKPLIDCRRSWCIRGLQWLEQMRLCQILPRFIQVVTPHFKERQNQYHSAADANKKGFFLRRSSRAFRSVVSQDEVNTTAKVPVRPRKDLWQGSRRARAAQRSPYGAAQLFRSGVAPLLSPHGSAYDAIGQQDADLPLPRQSYNLQTLSPARKMMHSPRRLRPHHRPRPIRPQNPRPQPLLSKRSDTRAPRFNAYHRFPSFPPSARTSLPRQMQDIPACTADFVAARSRIGLTRHDSRGPSHAN